MKVKSRTAVRSSSGRSEGWQQIDRAGRRLGATDCTPPDRGGTHVYINAQPQPGYVASTSAYFAEGFHLVERATTYAAPGRP